MVYVASKDRQPLMSTERYSKDGWLDPSVQNKVDAHPTAIAGRGMSFSAKYFLLQRLSQNKRLL